MNKLEFILEETRKFLAQIKKKSSKYSGLKEVKNKIHFFFFLYLH